METLYERVAEVLPYETKACGVLRELLTQVVEEGECECEQDDCIVCVAKRLKEESYLR